MSTKEEARQRLIDVLPHLKLAAGMAKTMEPDGEVKLAIVSKKADGSGRVGATFEGDAFLDDLVTVLDDPELNQIFSRKDPA